MVDIWINFGDSWSNHVDARPYTKKKKITNIHSYKVDRKHGLLGRGNHNSYNCIKRDSHRNGNTRLVMFFFFFFSFFSCECGQVSRPMFHGKLGQTPRCAGRVYIL